MIDLSWYTIPTGIFILLTGSVWYILFFKSLFYKIKLKKNLKEQKFSILTACRDEENVIGNFINDIKAQTYQNWELLICVNNTTDRTYERALECAKNDKRIKIFNHNPKEIGKASALNYILKKAKGDVILEFDTDNRLKEDYLIKLNEYFMDSNINAVQTVIKALNNKKNFLTKMQDIEFISFSRLFNKGRGKYGVGIGGTGFAIRKKLLLKMDGWANELVEDFDLFCKLQKNNIRVVHADNIMVYDEKPENFDDLIKQRKRWLKGHFNVVYKNLNMLKQNPFKLKFLLDFAYLLSPLYLFFTLSHLVLFYFYINGGSNYVTFFYFPISLWIFSIFSNFIMLGIILYREDKSLIKLIPIYTFLFSYHWIIVLFESFKVKSWADTKTVHKGV